MKSEPLSSGANIPGCRGFTLWPGKRLRLELWICRESVQRHRHPGQRVLVFPLWGRALFCREYDDGKGHGLAISWRVRRWLEIPAGCWHWFNLYKGPLVFLNLTAGISPAQNFVTQ